MKARHLLSGTALAATLAFGGGPAMAALINLGGYTGPIEIKFQNFESFTGTGTIAPSNSNFGVISVTSIVGGPGFVTTLWSSGAPGDGFISGVFNDIHVDTVTTSGGQTVSTNSGGHLAFYATTSNFDPTQGTAGYAAAGGGCTINQLCYNGITNVGGDNILNLDFVSGIDPTSPTTTLSATFNITTSPFTGTSQAYLNITGGTDTGQFVKGGFPTTFGARDIFLQNNFCVPGSAAACSQVGNWTFDSHDPASASIVGVPEPASMGILGSALAGLGFMMRRRRKSAQAA